VRQCDWFAGIPATGKQVQFPRIANGQMVAAWLMYDQLGFLQEIGAIPTSG
jgi:predicted ester cyclase